MQLSIIIVNYNVKYFLEHCLCSVRKAIAGIKSEIIVVDNASSDGSIEYLLSLFPEVIFIDNPENIGFARANNQGLKEASGKYILFLNPDTILSEECLSNCISFLESDSQSGACGVRMLDGSGKFLPESKRAFPSLQASFYKLSGLSGLFPHSKRLARYYLGHLSEKQNQEVDVLSGAFFMVKREALNKTGGFDEQFFMYGEDIDLSYRIQKEGYKNYYLAESSIIHFKGESTKKGSLDYVKIFYKAMSIFVQKYYKKNALWRSNRFMQLLIWSRAGLSAVSYGLSSQKKETKSVINITIVGNAIETAKALSILNRQQANRAIRQVSPGYEWEKNKVNLKNTDQIIFCEGELSYKNIIEHMEGLPHNISCFIYSNCAHSIAGSHSRNQSGKVLT